MVGTADSRRDLALEIERAARACGVQTDAASIRFRTSPTKPFSNRARLVGLVGASQIDAVCDPYLDSKALQTLSQLATFGVAFASPLRLLTGEAMVTGKRLDRSVVDAFLAEQNVVGGARAMPRKTTHGRFVLLASGQVILLGQSLNQIDNEDSIHLADDAAAEIANFEDWWRTATPVT
jgi:hypothetical protein